MCVCVCVCVRECVRVRVGVSADGQGVLVLAFPAISPAILRCAPNSSSKWSHGLSSSRRLRATTTTTAAAMRHVLNLFIGSNLLYEVKVYFQLRRAALDYWHALLLSLVLGLRVEVR